MSRSLGLAVSSLTYAVFEVSYHARDIIQDFQSTSSAETSLNNSKVAQTRLSSGQIIEYWRGLSWEVYHEPDQFPTDVQRT